MKKLLLAVVVVALSMPMMAGASDFVSQIKAGDYKNCKIESPNKKFNGLPCSATVKNNGASAEVVFTYQGGKETWTIGDNALDQQEVDLKTNKPGQRYGATAKVAPKNNKQTYHINCKVGGECDSKIDKRNYWEIEAKGNALTYKVYGVDPSKKDDSALKPQLRATILISQ